MLPLFGFICNDDGETSQQEKTFNNNKLVVMVDQSASISYKGREAELKHIIHEAFNQAYQYVFNQTEYLVCNITTQTNVVPKRHPFSEKFPNAEDLGGISQLTEIADWQSKKNLWIDKGVNDIYNGLLTPKTTSTDVYGSLQTLRLLAEDLSSKDTLFILFFSDMKQSLGQYELTDHLRTNEPEAFAEKEVKNIMRKQGLKKLDEKFQCRITIVTPDRFEESNEIVRFWTQFFIEIGVKTPVKWL